MNAVGFISFFVIGFAIGFLFARHRARTEARSLIMDLKEWKGR